MAMRQIHTDHAPAAIGPYSQAVVAGGMVYCSGQIALSPLEPGKLVGNTAAEQAIQCLANLKAVLEAAGSAPSLVVKTTIFLKDLNDFAAVNEAYGAFFGHHRPARATVQAARLPKDALVEIEAIAMRHAVDGGA